MRIFIVGGTRFVGPPLVRELLAQNHEVTLFNRGQTQHSVVAGVRTIQGDRKDTDALAAAIRECKPEVAVDMIPFTPEDSPEFMGACQGAVSRVVALSSIDVYLAYGRIHRTEPGSLIQTPLKEDAPLRETDKPEGRKYDKLSVERSVMGTPDLPGTILRLPAIYGPGDYQNRFHGYLKRMDDGRQAILLGQSMMRWKFSRGYVDNVAHAVTLAVENDAAAGAIYNVAEPSAKTEPEHIRQIGKVAGWGGEVVVMPDERLPKHLQHPVDFGQNWDVDTSKIRGDLGYEETVGLEESYRRTVAWKRDHLPQFDPEEFDYEAEDAALAGNS